MGYISELYVQFFKLPAFELASGRLSVLLVTSSTSTVIYPEIPLCFRQCQARADVHGLKLLEEKLAGIW